MNVAQRLPINKRVYNSLNSVQKSLIDFVLNHPDYMDLNNSSFFSKNKRKTVSVIIPHYNQQLVLAQTIDSILSSTILPEEIIVVDDVSNDRNLTKKVLEPYKNKVTSFYPEKKLFLSGARNYGAQQAHGDILIFLDSDDIIHPQRIEIVKSLFSEHKNMTSLFSATISFTDIIPQNEIYSKENVQNNLIEPIDLLRSFCTKSFARTKLSYISPVTNTVPWYAWGGIGIKKQYGIHTGSMCVLNEVKNILQYHLPKECVFTPYEDLEYASFLLLLTKGLFQIDLPLIFYRRGYTTSTPVQTALE
jgi:glycosyltransferase involved in cell wall biosynthesis